MSRKSPGRGSSVRHTRVVVMRWASLWASLWMAGVGCDAPGGAAPSAAGAPSGPPPALVRVDRVSSGVLDDSRTYLGRIEPLQSVVLAAAVAGVVARVDVRSGDAVAVDQVLVELDRALIDPAISSASAEEARVEAEQAQAVRELRRAESLPHPVITDAERERYSARVEVLRAQAQAVAARVRQLRAERARHHVRAPFAGRVRAREVEPGAWVGVGAPLLSLVSADEQEIVVEVGRELLGTVAVGDTVQVRAGGSSALAKVVGVVPVLAGETRTATIRARVAERPEWLLAGMAVEVSFALRVGGEGALVVPRDALVRGPAGVRVVVVREEKAVLVPVEVVSSVGDRAVVRAGDLTVGDPVITRGNERVRPGQPVRIAGE